MAATYKQAQDAGIAPWNNVYREYTNVWVYNDGYPDTAGHLLFVPKINTQEVIVRLALNRWQQ